MKKLFPILVATLLLTLFLAACSQQAEITETEPKNMNIYQKDDPAKDDVLNILMIGNSGCYYYVDELYGMLYAAGIKANVCNVYYDGCKLSQHWKWWKSKESHYDYFITNENGRVKTASCDLDWCLQQQNWDVISLQEGGMAELRTVSTEEAVQARDIYLKELYGYLREQFPHSGLYWHEGSAYQIGYNRKFSINTIEEQRQDTKMHRDFALAICEKYNVIQIPRGDAAMMVREAGYDNLCARLGIGNNNEGDFYHDGDWGGGQFLTACVWFEMLTGQSCLTNSYRPVYNYQGQEYTLDDALVTTLQESAHKAVEQMNIEEAS